MSLEREAVVWCPKCREEKGEILRVPTSNPAVFTNKTNPSPLPKYCDCGTVIVRKP